MKYTKTRPSRIRTALALVAALALIASAHSLGAQQNRFFNGGAKSTKPKEDPVATELLADVSAIEPGVPFRAGIRFKLQPEWHIYWRYAGNVGLPPSIKWNLPEGFKVGDLQWPNPVRIDDTEAKLVSYAYEDEVLLFVTVTPPANLAGGSKVTLKTENEWLVCKVQCIPGDSTNSLELPVGKAAPSASAPLFDRFTALVPVKAGDASLPIKVQEASSTSVAPGGKSAEKVEVKADGPWRLLFESGSDKAAFFPAGSDAWDVRQPAPPKGEGETDVKGKKAYASLSFEWGIEPYKTAKPGEYPAATALTLPAVNSETGETKIFRAALERKVSIGTSPVVASAGGTQNPPSPTAAPSTSTKEPAAAGATAFNFLDAAAKPKTERSLLLLLFYALVGGLILNVMPCVLPVLSIKILGFVRQAGDDPRRIFHLGLVFGLGVLVSFAALASIVVGAKAGGSQIGWGFQLQEPRFIIIVAAVIFAFALSLFGVFEIDLPGAATQRLDGLQRREGASGAFFNGVLATLLATPCTAPLLGPALGFAFSQPPAMIYLFFLTIGVGLAAPYVLLSANPRWLRFVPKAGPWMETFKQAMGFLLVATVIWLLWVLGKTTGSDGIVWTLCFLAGVGAACWLLGREMGLGASATRRTSALAGALVLIALSYFIFPERYLSKVGQSVASATPTIAPKKSETASNEIEWQPFSFDLVNTLTAQKKTVFVDFTADWCWTCKLNENAVLKKDDVAEAFKKYGVEAVTADYTRRQPELTKILQQFGRAGVPMYLIFPAGHPEDYILLPEVLTPGLVKDKLAEAAGGATKVASGAGS